jgi:hypothetical protein
MQSKFKMPNNKSPLMCRTGPMAATACRFSKMVACWSQKQFMLFAKNYYMQKKLSVSVIFVFFSFCLLAQSRFNLGWAIERQTGFESVYALEDSTFIVNGWSLDSVTNFHVNFTLSHISSNGEVMQNMSFQSSNTFNAGDCDSETRVPNLFVQAKPTFVEDNFAFQLIWFNENLDTLFSRFVFSPYLDSAWTSSSFLMPTFTIVQKDSCVFMSAGIFNSLTTANDFCIKKFSPSGDELWTYIHSELSDDACYALLPL